MALNRIHAMDAIVVTTTFEREAEAEQMARMLVERRLAACVQISPVRSVYRWKGAVESASEFLLAAKTRAALASSAVKFIRQNHSYELPEILVFNAAGGLPEYLQWLFDSTDKA